MAFTAKPKTDKEHYPTIVGKISSDSDVMVVEDEIYSALESTMTNLRQCDGAFHVVAVWEDPATNTLHQRTIGFNGEKEGTGSIQHRSVHVDPAEREDTLHATFLTFSNALCIDNTSTDVVIHSPNGDEEPTCIIRVVPE